MSLRLIYGRAGSGKSQYCFEEISHIISKEQKIYIITPEQFSFTAEQKLLEMLPQKASIHAEVLTFQRMAYRVMNEVGGINKVPLSSSGKAMLLKRILEQEKKELCFLGKSEETIDTVNTAITEFKKHAIGVEELRQAVENTKNEYLKAKLRDLSKLYEAYEDKITDNYIDEEDILTVLSHQLSKTDLYGDTVIYLDEFVGFTKQEQQILRQLLKVAKQVNVTVCTDSLQESKKKETDIFASNKQTALQLLQIAREEGIAIEQDIVLEKNRRFKTEELSHLEQYLYAPKSEAYVKEVNHIHLELAMNPFTEIEEVATQIIQLVRQKQYRYHDIAVIAKNLDTYSNLAKAVFARYEIPLFLDEKKELSQNILIKYILAMLEIFSKSWSWEAMFNYLKTGLCPIPQEDIFALENYCLKWGIRGSKWYKEEWQMADSQEEKEQMNALRKRIIEPLLTFGQKLDKTKTVKEITKAMYEFLEENHTQEQLQQKMDALEEMGQLELAEEYALSWDILIDVLDELVMVLQEEKISFEEYAKILKIGLKNSGLGKIPGTCDQVIMGDVERSRTHKVKAVFLVGLNDGIFPSVRKEEGFLNDEERNHLKEEGIELAKNTLEALYEDNFNSYKAFTTAEQEMYLSYSSSDSSGKSLRPSMLIPKIKKIYPSLKEESNILQENNVITTKRATFDQLLLQIRRYQDGETIDSIWFSVWDIYAKDAQWKQRLEEAVKGLKYTNEPAKLNSQNVQKLYGDTIQTSISRLEQYKRCAFSFYLKYGLQLAPKNTFKIQSLDTGTFMHDVVDDFFDQVLQRQLKLKELTQEQLEEIIENIINEKLTLHRNYIFTSTAKYVVLTKRLKKVILTSMKYIIQSITQSDFDVVGNEVEFRKNATYPPITIELDDGKKIELTGKIDRIDLAQDKEGKYLRIIDYKSSVKNIDLNEVVAGLQLQLLTYLDAVTKLEEVIPAGVLYFNVIDPIIKAGKNKTQEEIELEIKKKFKMQGLILADVTVVRKMDKTLEKGASTLIPAYIDASDTISSKMSSSVTKEQFEQLQKYTYTLMKQIAKEMLSGSISLKPYYQMKNKKTPCEYCEYKTICQFNSNQNGYNYIPNLDKHEVLEKIREEVDNDKPIQ